MATEFLREKINTLNSLILSEALQVFQHELLIDASATTSGDEQVDKAMRDNATNAKAVVIGATKRLTTYRDKLTTLQAELDAATKPSAPQGADVP